eukprot:c6641_g1_i1.p2 GENE.c6641_g1_i1~~c6641_g1_i1.p2  ORF type:complete len:250 (+),score=44.40 c6641_g1_i1:765-1514(+)
MSDKKKRKHTEDSTGPSVEGFVKQIQDNPDLLRSAENKFFVDFLRSPVVASFLTPQHKPDEHRQHSAYDLPLGSKFPELVPCFVEVTKGSRNKYEWDEELGFLVLDRVLHSAVNYPYDYGFIPQTLCGDGDPLDVLVIGHSPIQPGSLVWIRPIAYMVMEDEKGQDEKVLAVSAKDPFCAGMHTLQDIQEPILREITHFFENYKSLERDKWVKVGGWKGTQDTLELLVRTHKTYQEKKDADGHIEYAKH